MKQIQIHGEDSEFLFYFVDLSLVRYYNQINKDVR